MTAIPQGLHGLLGKMVEDVHGPAPTADEKVVAPPAESEPARVVPPSPDGETPPAPVAPREEQRVPYKKFQKAHQDAKDLRAANAKLTRELAEHQHQAKLDGLARGEGLPSDFETWTPERQSAFVSAEAARSYMAQQPAAEPEDQGLGDLDLDEVRSLLAERKMRQEFGDNLSPGQIERVATVSDEFGLPPRESLALARDRWPDLFTAGAEQLPPSHRVNAPQGERSPKVKKNAVKAAVESLNKARSQADIHKAGPELMNALFNPGGT